MIVSLDVAKIDGGERQEMPPSIWTRIDGSGMLRDNGLNERVVP